LTLLLIEPQDTESRQRFLMPNLRYRLIAILIYLLLTLPITIDIDHTLEHFLKLIIDDFGNRV
jgi:hypothetical protein